MQVAVYLSVCLCLVCIQLLDKRCTNGVALRQFWACCAADTQRRERKIERMFWRNDKQLKYQQVAPVRRLIPLGSPRAISCAPPLWNQDDDEDARTKTIADLSSVPARDAIKMGRLWSREEIKRVEEGRRASTPSGQRAKLCLGGCVAMQRARERKLFDFKTVAREKCCFIKELLQE